MSRYFTVPVVCRVITGCMANQLTRPHLSVKLYIDQSSMIKIQDKQLYEANCEYLLQSISCEMNADQFLFVLDLNERQSDSRDLEW